MTKYIYKNPGKESIWVGDVCIKPGASIEATAYKPDLEPLVGKGLLTKKVIEKADKHPGEAYLAKKLGEKGASAEIPEEDEIVEETSETEEETEDEIVEETEDEIVEETSETEDGADEEAADSASDEADED